MYQMIYRISINLYWYEYRIEKTGRYPALLSTLPIVFSDQRMTSIICKQHAAIQKVC